MYDLRKSLTNMSYVLRGGTLFDGYAYWSLYKDGWWKASEESPGRWVTRHADTISLSVIGRGTPQPAIAKIQGGNFVDIKKVLTNLSALLRGRTLVVTLDGERKTVVYDSYNNSLHVKIPAVEFVGGEAKPSSHTFAAPDMTVGEFITLLNTGELYNGQ